MMPDILLIADNTDLYQQVTNILYEYDVDWCVASEASNICIHQPVRVVLVVQDLPGTSRLDLFASLRESWPCLLGFLIVDREVAGNLCPYAVMDSDFSGLFSPPLDPDQVREKVEKAMECASLREENVRCNRPTLTPWYYGLWEHFISFTTKHDVLESLFNVISDQTKADILSVMLYDEMEGVLRIAASRNLPEEIVDKVKTKPGDKIAGRVFQKRRPVILNQETQNESRFADLLKRPEIVSAVSAPMIVRDKILGVLNISYTDGDVRFADSDIEIIGILSTQVAWAIENVDALESRLQVLLEERARKRGTDSV